jgi:hypothetical protein
MKGLLLKQDCILAAVLSRGGVQENDGEQLTEKKIPNFFMGYARHYNLKIV